MPAGEIDAFYKEQGYFPALSTMERRKLYQKSTILKAEQPVAVTLGTSYDEWCLAQIAKDLGKEDEYEHFMKKLIELS